MKTKLNRFAAALGLGLGMSAGMASAGGIDPRYDFGKIPFGADVDRVPVWAVNENCSRAPDTFNGCSFFDRDGVEYVVIDYQIREKVIAVTAANRGSLPFGIDPKKSPVQIVGDVSKRLGLKFTEEEDGVYGSDAIAPETYDAVAIFLRFDKGQIVTVHLWSNAT